MEWRVAVSSAQNVAHLVRFALQTDRRERRATSGEADLQGRQQQRDENLRSRDNLQYR